MHEGLSVATLFAVRGSEYRGAVCYKAIHAADSAVTGVACVCKRFGRASGFRMALNRTGLQGSGDKRRCYRQGFRKVAFPYWVM